MSKPIVLITGALTGIGRATAMAFAREGASLVVSGRHDDAGNTLAKELRTFGGEAEFIKADVRYENEVRNLIEQTLKRFGRLDIAVNNAGTEGKPGPVIDQTAETYAAVFETNVLGVLLCLKHELLVMQSQKSGNIVNISSTAGQIGLAGASVYCASKHAVEGMTKCAALEAAPYGIRVNIVAPGPIDTAMLERFTGSRESMTKWTATLPLMRPGKPEEIADAVVFISSDKASFITGTTLGVNGGKLLQ